MTVIADIAVPTGSTRYAPLFESCDPSSCELEPVLDADGRSLWISGASASAIEDALASATEITSHALLDDRGDALLYSVVCPGADDVFDLAVVDGGSVLHATAADAVWHLRVRYVDREHLREGHARLDRHGFSPTLLRLFDLERDRYATAGLTPSQHETLVAAVDHGYFDIPRAVSMQELAAELDVSHQALSERLRRAYRSLVAMELNLTDERRRKPQLTTNVP